MQFEYFMMTYFALGDHVVQQFQNPRYSIYIE